MSDDLIRRLRTDGWTLLNDAGWSESVALDTAAARMGEAADEIERLRAIVAEEEAGGRPSPSASYESRANLP